MDYELRPTSWPWATRVFGLQKKRSFASKKLHTNPLAGERPQVSSKAEVLFNGSEKARQEISSNAHEALETYTQLRGLSNELNSRNEKAWGSMIHLTEYVEATTRQLWEEMEQILSV